MDTLSSVTTPWTVARQPCDLSRHLCTQWGPLFRYKGGRRCDLLPKTRMQGRPPLRLRLPSRTGSLEPSLRLEHQRLGRAGASRALRAPVSARRLGTPLSGHRSAGSPERALGYSSLSNQPQ